MAVVESANHRIVRSSRASENGQSTVLDVWKEGEEETDLGLGITTHHDNGEGVCWAGLRKHHERLHQILRG